MIKYYKEQIKKLVDKLNDEKRLKYIYQLLLKFLAS